MGTSGASNPNAIVPPTSVTSVSGLRPRLPSFKTFLHAVNSTSEVDLTNSPADLKWTGFGKAGASGGVTAQYLSSDPFEVTQRIPQPIFDPHYFPSFDARQRPHIITFYQQFGRDPHPRVAYPQGVSLSDFVDGHAQLLGGDIDTVVYPSSTTDYMRIWISWPGYSSILFNREIKLNNGRIRTSRLFGEVARAILGFITQIENGRTAVEPGNEDWRIGPDGGIQGPEIVVFGLEHRGQENWHPLLEVAKPNL